jgi:hypothetical protein
MSSQASGAGRDEAKVRRKIIETGHMDENPVIIKKSFEDVER